MRKDVRAFADVAPSLQPGQKDRVKSIGDWFYFIHRTVQIHHEGEDRDFCPLLTEKDPSFAVHQEKIFKDHQQLVAQMREVKLDLDRLAESQDEDFPRRRDELATKLVALRDFLEGHMEHEEEDLVSCAKSCMTVRELRGIENEGGRRIPIRDLALVLPWVMAVADDSERQSVMSLLPLPARYLYRFWWKGRFERMTNPLLTA
jgi:hemerythrin-like domain-containing protein